MCEKVVGIVSRGRMGDTPVEETQQIELHLLKFIHGVVFRISQPGQVLHLFNAGKLVFLVLKFGCVEMEIKQYNTIDTAMVQSVFNFIQ